MTIQDMVMAIYEILCYFRLSVNMSGAPDSPNSRVSYSWGEEASVDESGVQPHTPKIINRQQQPESHLKAPPKEKVSKEEVLYVSTVNLCVYESWFIFCILSNFRLLPCSSTLISVANQLDLCLLFAGMKLLMFNLCLSHS